MTYPNHPNVLQVELFSRTGEKTVFRFFDHSGEFTTIAQTHQALGKLRDDSLKRLCATRGIRRWWHGRKLRSVSRAMSEQKRKASVLLEKYLDDDATEHETVALERLNRTFRKAQKHRVRSLCSAAWPWSNIWLFVFAPNALIADKNVSVARLM